MYLGSTENNTVHYHVAVRSIGIICQSSIHSSDYVIAKTFIISNSLGKLFSFPELCLICHAIQREVIGIELVNSVITGENLNIFILSVNLKIVNNLTVITICVVQYQLSFRSTGSQSILVFGDYLEIIIRNRCIKV